MANKGEEITTKFRVDISELKANIQEANRQIKLANSEFKAVSSGMDNWQTSTDGVTKKLEQLGKVEDAEITKLNALKTQYQLVAQEQGETSTEAQNLLVKLNNQQATVNKVQTSIKQYTQQLESMGDSANQTKTATQKLSDEIADQESELTTLKAKYKDVILAQGDTSDEAKQLASQIGRLSDELNKSKSKMNEADKATDKLAGSLGDVENEAEQAGDGFTIMGGALANVVGGAISAGIAKIGEFVGSLFTMAEATQEYRQMMTKLSGASDTFGYSMDFAKKKYEQFYGYVADDQMATNAITNLMGIGTSTESLSAIADGAIGVWASYGDSIPIESLTEAINETIQVGKVTGTFADTINWAKTSQEGLSSALGGNTTAQQAFNKALNEGLPAEDAFNEALATITSTQERADVVAQFLNTTYGKSKGAYDELSQGAIDANKAELDLKDTQAELGKAMEPVNSAITELKDKALEAILPVVKDVAQGFLDFNNYLKENPEQAKILTAVVTGLATAFGVLAVSLGIVTLINLVKNAFVALNAVMLANPIILIGALIAGLVATFLYLWNNVDGFKQFFIDTWEKIKTSVSNFVDAIVNFFTVTIPQAWDKFKEYLAQLWETIKQGFDDLVTWFAELPGKIWTWLTELWNKIVQFGNDMWAKAVEIGQTFVDNLVNFIKELPGKIWDWLVKAKDKVVEWGRQMVDTGKQKATEFVTNVINFIKELPGKIWTWLSNIISDIGQWGRDMVNKGAQVASDLADAIVDGVKGIPGQMLSIGGDIVSGIWNGIKDMGGWISRQIGNFASGIVNGFKSALGINSPSRVFAGISKWIPAGVGEGIKDNSKLALKQVKTLTGKMTDEAKKMADAIGMGEIKSSLTSSVNSLKGRVSNATSAIAEKAQTATNVVFNQYNNSPKAMSRLDVYRQTKTQLVGAKEKLKYV